MRSQENWECHNTDDIALSRNFRCWKSNTLDRSTKVS